MYLSLLVPLDRSSSAKHALPMSLSIARRAKARLDLVEVHARYDPEDHGDREVQPCPTIRVRYS
jgi:hypothetical protein